MRAHGVASPWSLSTEEPYLSAKEPNTFVKEPYLAAKEPYNSTKEPNLFAKEP